MRSPRVRFTIRHGMIAVAMVAALLVMPPEWSLFLGLFAIPVLAGIGARWLIHCGDRRTAALGFWGLAILINAAYVAACTYPHYMLVNGLLLLAAFIILPTLASLGAAWATLASRADTVRGRSSPAAVLSVVFLAALPVITVLTLWPLRLAFLACRPTLDRLADQVAAGQTFAFPQDAGVYRLVGHRLDPSTDNVGLITDPHPSGPAGFVRIGPRGDPAGPFSMSGMGADLGWGWSYRQED